jgi:hypothetical protein
VWWGWLRILVLGLPKSVARCEKLQSGFLQNSISSSFSDHKTRVLLYCEIPQIESIALSSLGCPLGNCGCSPNVAAHSLNLDVV